MTSSKRIAAIVNPHSAGGKTGRHWNAIAQKLNRRLGPVTSRFTDSPGAAIRLARDLVDEGYKFLIAVGGDGTANEVANGLIKQDHNPRPEVSLGLLPMGTGGDFRRSLGISTNIDEAVEVLYSGRPAAIDLGKATYHTSDGQVATRYFLNLVSFGMGGEVASRARNALGALGGRAAFLWATLVSFLKYKGRRVQVRLNGIDQSFFITNIAVGNGRFHGGGMHPCPTALLNDGMLEVTVIDHLSALELVRDIHYLYSDDVYRHPKVHHLQARNLRADAEEITKIEIDGEPLGSLPLEVSILPDKLNVIVPDGGAAAGLALRTQKGP